VDNQRVDVIAQWVRTTWTKHSRGGAAAQRRATVPVAFPLPEVAAPMVHEVTVDELLVPQTVVRYDEPRPDEVELMEESALLRVHLVPDPSGGKAAANVFQGTPSHRVDERATL
jgi:hypothetical protein